MIEIKIIRKLEIITISQVNTEVQHIVYVIQDLMCLMKFKSKQVKFLLPFYNKRISKRV